MSVGPERGTAQTPPGRHWQNWRFHLSALVLLVPVVALPGYLEERSGSHPDTMATERVPVRVGPFDLLIAVREETGRYPVSVMLCPGCDDRIREVRADLDGSGAVRLRSQPMALSAVLSGGGNGTPTLGISITGWDGAEHRTTVPLADLGRAARP